MLNLLFAILIITNINVQKFNKSIAEKLFQN